MVNDGFADFSASRDSLGRLETSDITVSYPWIEGSAYEVRLVTSTGATIDHEIPVAVETPDSDLGFYGLMALLGFYVGVLPVTLGMLWLPFVRRIDPRWLRVLMALTIGLLGFLAIDATLEGIDVAAGGSQALGGTALVFVGRDRRLPCADGGGGVAPGPQATGSGRAMRAVTWRCSSPSRSGCTTSARDSRSGPPTRSEHSRWARSS